jgi:predicted nucleic acid-binding protein
VILYLDTSSLLKLYVEESGTADVQAQAEAAEVVATSVIAYPEAVAAVARRGREGALSRFESRTILERFRETWPRYLALQVSMPLARRAGALALAHRLRGMDAVHLASYVDLLEAGEPVGFLSHDARLQDAAARERRVRRTQP